MTITHDQSATATAVSAGSVVLTWATPPTAGSKVIVKVVLSGTTAVSAVDNGSTPTTFTPDVALSAFGAFVWAYTFRGDAITLPSVGSYHVTITFSGSVPAVAFGDSWLGVSTGGPTGSNSDAGTGSSTDTGTVTPAVTGALCTAVLATDSGLNPETITLTSGTWTNRAQLTNGTIACGASADIIVSGTSAQQATWTTGDAPNWMGEIAVYSPAPAAGPAFPDSPLDLQVELDVNGAWTSMHDRLDHAPVVISRGHPDESTTVSPSTLTVSLTNSDAALSADNATSPWFPYIVQNIPLRVSIPEGASYMRSETDTASGAGTNGVTAVTGDLDIAVDLTLDNGWTGPALLASHWLSAGNQRGWLLAVNDGGTLTWGFTTGGTMASYQAAVSTVPVIAQPGGRLSARVTYNHSTGVVTFWTSTTALNASPSWGQLGATVTLTPAAIFATTALLDCSVAAVAAADFTVTNQWGITTVQWPSYQGKYHGLIMKNGIAGTVVASPDFTAQTAGATSFHDAQGNIWLLSGTTEISARNYRGHFEVPEWPQDEPVYQAGTVIDVVAPVAGGGLLRRWSQRGSPVLSAVTRGIAQLAISPGLAAAWPMEDIAGSTQFASSIGGPAMNINGTPTLASSSVFPGTSALPVCTNGASFSGQVPAYSGTWTDNVARCLLQVPLAGDTNGAVIMSIRTTGTAVRADLTYGSSGTLALHLYDATGTQIVATGSLTPFGAGVNGQPCRVSINLQTSGGNILYWIEAMRLDGTGAQTTASASTAGFIGQVLEVALNPGGLLLNTVFGGCTIQPLRTIMNDLLGPVQAWASEPAGVRFQRLCAETGIQCRVRGQASASTLMGTQQPQTLTGLLQECADADMGVWTELRQQLGWGYVTRQALYNQQPVMAVSHSLDHLSPWKSMPTRDDATIANDITVSSPGGSSARMYAAPGQPIPGGRLSTLAPPAGVGTYDPPYSANVWLASQLAQIAAWKLHLGTVDQGRFPGIVIDLSNRALASLYTAALTMDLGHRLTIANPPPWLQWDQVSQLAQDLTETLWTKDLEIAVTGVPELPYEVLALASGNSLDTDGTTLTAGVTSSATSLSFTTAAGSPVWTTSAGDFPFQVKIAGEVMSVTNITGSTSPQTATVIRSINRVVKAQLAGAAVNVWPPPAFGL